MTRSWCGLTSFIRCSACAHCQTCPEISVSQKGVIFDLVAQLLDFALAEPEPKSFANKEAAAWLHSYFAHAFLHPPRASKHASNLSTAPVRLACLEVQHERNAKTTLWCRHKLERYCRLLPTCRMAAPLSIFWKNSATRSIKEEFDLLKLQLIICATLRIFIPFQPVA